MVEPKLKLEYTYSQTFNLPNHTWTCIGGVGAIHLHIRAYKRDAEIFDWTSGIEYHSRRPFKHAPHDAPNHADCWLLNEPCWHEGSSLYAQEVWFPRWKAEPHAHDQMFDALREEYRKHFINSEEN